LLALHITIANAELRSRALEVVDRAPGGTRRRRAMRYGLAFAEVIVMRNIELDANDLVGVSGGLASCDKSAALGALVGGAALGTVGWFVDGVAGVVFAGGTGATIGAHVGAAVNPACYRQRR
jgi:hypothetical protein